MDGESKEILKEISTRLKETNGWLKSISENTDTTSCLLATLNPSKKIKEAGYVILIPRLNLDKKGMNKFLDQIGVDLSFPELE